MRLEDHVVVRILAGDVALVQLGCCIRAAFNKRCRVGK